LPLPLPLTDSDCPGKNVVILKSFSFNEAICLALYSTPPFWTTLFFNLHFLTGQFWIEAHFAPFHFPDSWMNENEWKLETAAKKGSIIWDGLCWLGWTMDADGSNGGGRHAEVCKVVLWCPSILRCCLGTYSHTSHPSLHHIHFILFAVSTWPIPSIHSSLWLTFPYFLIIKWTVTG
jgi:hypothetical protein